MSITFVLEKDMFEDGHERLAQAAKAAGHRIVFWNDAWWESNSWPGLDGEHVVFHGSLGNASRIKKDIPWRPGVYCNTRAFSCSSWYEGAREWLLHPKWVTCSAVDFVKDPAPYLSQIDATDSFFIRPDSPLKPFSGRVLQLKHLSMKALDFGFYFDDERIPVVITPVVEVGEEWRFVIQKGKPVAASAYTAKSRSAAESNCPPEVWEFAENVASKLRPPDPVYVLDVCRSGNSLRLLELNPFSGADLYACDRAAIVAALESEK